MQKLLFVAYTRIMFGGKINFTRQLIKYILIDLYFINKHKILMGAYHITICHHVITRWSHNHYHMPRARVVAAFLPFCICSRPLSLFRWKWKLALLPTRYRCYAFNLGFHSSLLSIHIIPQFSQYYKLH